MQYKDYYKIMGVDKNATQDEIKRAYRKLARKYHPDVSKERDAEKKFKELGEAYEVLKDPQKRAAYDRMGSNFQDGQPFTPPPGWDAGFVFRGGGFTDHDSRGFSEFFESLFGQQRATENRSRHYESYFHTDGSDQHAKILIDLEDSFHGTTRSLSLTVPELDEQGHVINKQRVLNVKIPKGITAGQRIRLSGQGGSGYGQGKNGDLYLTIEFNKHPWFHAEGKDLYLDLPVTPWESALGGSISIPTPDGTVSMKIPPNSQSGQKLRLKNKGLPGTPRGDLYAVLRIVTPPAHSAEQKALYEQMAKTMPMNPRAKMGV